MIVGELENTFTISILYIITYHLHILSMYCSCDNSIHGHQQPFHDSCTRQTCRLCLMGVVGVEWGCNGVYGVEWSCSGDVRDGCCEVVVVEL